MGLYEGIKDVAAIVQKADNIELYAKLLDLQAQALEMQAEIASLREENTTLRKEKAQQDEIIYHKIQEDEDYDNEYPYVTLKSDTEQIRYCGICWGKHNKLIPLYDKYHCIVCGQEFKHA